MTLAELERAIASYNRKEKERRKEKAIYDYTLANLIGRSCARIHNNSIKMPEISAVYPDLFNDETIAAETKEEISAIRFKLFAQSYNDKRRARNGRTVKNKDSSAGN
jgi:hypothetical protein